MKEKLIRNIIAVALVLILAFAFFIYQTHKSVDQELTQDDIALKNILENNEKETEITKNEEVQSQDKEENKDSKEESQEEPLPEIKTEENPVQKIKSGDFNPDARGSDNFHRGWGGVEVLNFEGKNKIVFDENFKVTNGPDYKLYLIKKKDIETDDEFLNIKDDSISIADVKQFNGFQTFEIPNSVNLDEIEGVVIWCESFSKFITSANLN